MKKMIAVFIFLLLTVFVMPTTAFSASPYTVDKVDYTAELRNDGTALITEEWTVTFSDEADGFVREIMIPEDIFETYSSITDISVSVDGNGCSELNSTSAVSGTYTAEKAEDRYIINWYMPSENETRTFSLRYVQTGTVKLYNDRAYFYCNVLGEDSNMLCRNVTVTVTTPENCFQEDFTIIESGSLAGKKSDGQVVFSAENSAGEIQVGITMPSELFNSSSLTVIVDDNTPIIIALSVIGVLLIIIAALCVYSVLNYRRLFRKHWEKKCAKKMHGESLGRSAGEVFKVFSPAEVLNTVAAETVSGADKFLVTFLDLYVRGYIKVSSSGFAVSERSDTDTVNRPLDENEKLVMEFFGRGNWLESRVKPKRFYKAAEKFNGNIKFVSPVFALSSRGKKIIRRCFDIKFAASNHEFIPPAEISDEIFKGRNFSAAEIVISLLKEYDLSRSSEPEEQDEKYINNIFLFRDVYEQGRICAIKEEERKNEYKRRNRRKSGGSR